MTTRLYPRLLLIFTLLLSPLAMADGADFALESTKGKVIKLSDFRGRWVVVNFWATWCAPCIKEIPEFIEFQAKYPHIQVLGVNFEQKKTKDIAPFLERFKFNYPLLMANDLPLVPFEPLKGLPTTAIIDPKGQVASKHTGPVTLSMLEDFFRAEGALNKKSASK
jgi:thiol-disulfide isomerase/thioredoxin